LLLQNGVELEERDFFKDEFTEAEIRGLAEGVGLEQLFARRSPSLKKMGLAGQDLSEAEMLDLMLKEPRLVRRPLIRMGDRLIVGASIKAVEAALA
jgi:arsenate reductase/regulatory protein spx